MVDVIDCANERQSANNTQHLGAPWALVGGGRRGRVYYEIHHHQNLRHPLPRACGLGIWVPQGS